MAEFLVIMVHSLLTDFLQLADAAECKEKLSVKEHKRRFDMALTKDNKYNKICICAILIYNLIVPLCAKVTRIKTALLLKVFPCKPR